MDHYITYLYVYIKNELNQQYILISGRQKDY